MYAGVAFRSESDSYVGREATLERELSSMRDLVDSAVSVHAAVKSTRPRFIPKVKRRSTYIHP